MIDRCTAAGDGSFYVATLNTSATYGVLPCLICGYSAILIKSCASI
jgi:hypothetical protein